MPAEKLKDLMALAVAAGAIAIGLFILVTSFDIRLGSGYDRIGPRFFPFVVATGLLITGIYLLVECLVRTRGECQDRIDWMAFTLLVVALLLTVVLLEPAGFIIAATLLFVLAARAFTSRHIVRDAVTGLLLALTVYFTFTIGLGLVLPRGVLAGAI